MCFYFLLIANSGLCLLTQRFSNTNPALLYPPLLLSPLLKATCYFEKMRHSLSCFNWHGKQRKRYKKGKTHIITP